MNPPAMAGWNLALRFGLELGALVSLVVAAWTLTSGPARWAAALAVPLLAVVAWGVFNVAGDPSRSGAAPVEVPGWVRLALELVILGGGAAALGVAGRAGLGAGFALLVAVQYVTAWDRVRWLLDA